jgi:hypothetical protein
MRPLLSRLENRLSSGRGGNEFFDQHKKGTKPSRGKGHFNSIVAVRITETQLSLYLAL